MIFPISLFFDVLHGKFGKMPQSLNKTLVIMVIW